jgi:hypothetical protein
MSLGHILKDVAKMGGFGIAGAIIANHHKKPHPVFPGLTMAPEASQFQDPTSYLQAMSQWAQGGLQQMQSTQNPFGGQGTAPSQVPPQGGGM